MQNGKPIARQSNIKYEDLQIGRWGCHSKTKNGVLGCARDNFFQYGSPVIGHRSRTIRRCMIVSQCLEHRMHKKFYKVRKYELCRYGGTYVCTSLENPHAYIAEWTSYKTLGCINDPGSRPHSPQGMYVPLSDCSCTQYGLISNLAKSH